MLLRPITIFFVQKRTHTRNPSLALAAGGGTGMRGAATGSIATATADLAIVPYRPCSMHATKDEVLHEKVGVSSCDMGS